ncbi:MAG: spondin domain-containing protein [Burkholderiales bacterium]|nr:spondin domain-containing protein [Nitrosomonas sp.]MCP5276259.1 spondin domain-containing protein [Burkholderiales bacterium]
MVIKKFLYAMCMMNAAFMLTIANSWASGNHGKITYQIAITNLTPGQPITPPMAATHHSGISFFDAGDAPTPELAALAEAGDGTPMAAKLINTPGYRDAQVGSSGIGPGETGIMIIHAHSKKDHLSLGAMLGNTNDAFIALRDVALPKGNRSVTYFANAYDAGSETNDESCSTIPGPACGGAGPSPEDEGEGFVHIHNGIHGIGGLDAALYDWRNPAAQVVIKRIP